MARVDVHFMALHGVLDFIDNRLPRSFDAQDLRNLNNMVG